MKMDYLPRVGRCLCGYNSLQKRFLQRCLRFPRKNIGLRACGTTTDSQEPQVRVRFAPSPTGQLHLGGLRTALYNFLYARAHNGRFILRVEDTDQTRLVPGATEKLVEMLQWSGIQIDEGPGFGGDLGPYTQSERINIYWEHIQPLIKSGAAYFCFCSQRRLELLKKDALRRREVPKYDNRCRHLTPEEVEAKLKVDSPYVIRLKLEPHTEPWQDLVFGPIISDVAEVEGDPVLLKTDRYPTYHFANVVDDHLMNVTHVLRGVEWVPSTTKHILLYQAFGWSPPKFAHLPLLLNKDGTKLSKRQNDIHVQYFKEGGYFPESVLNLLTSAGSGFTVSDTAGMTMADLINNFDLSLLKTNSTRLELDRIDDYNRHQLQARVGGAGRGGLVGEVRRLATVQLSQRYNKEEDWQHLIEERYIERVLDRCQTRICRVDDLFSATLAFLWFVPDLTSTTNSLTETIPAPTVSAILARAAETLEGLDEEGCQDTKDIAKSLKALTKELGVNMKTLMTVLRLTLAGLKEGPAVAEIISILGKEESLGRLGQCLQGLSDAKSTEGKDVKTSPS